MINARIFIRAPNFGPILGHTLQNTPKCHSMKCYEIRLKAL